MEIVKLYEIQCKPAKNGGRKLLGGKIQKSADAAEYVRKLYKSDIMIYESFYVVALNSSHDIIGYMKISQGGINATVVDVRLVAKFCIDTLATACILCHNHPSGNIKPSEADRQITNVVKSGLQTLNITLLDHIIVTKNDHFSFADDCIL